MNYLTHPLQFVFSMICFSGFGQSGIVSITYDDKITYFNCATHEDTVLLDLTLSLGDVIVTNFDGASDPYNNRYFFGAGCDSLSGYRIFTYDLLSGALTASDVFSSFEELYYDPFENGILFRDSNNLKRYSLDNSSITTIGTFPNKMAGYYGNQHQAYDFVHQQLFYNYLDETESFHYMLFDLSTGTVISDTNLGAFPLPAPSMLVHDDGNNSYYGIVYGDVLLVNPLTFNNTHIATIPDLGSMLNNEMAMFDHLKGHYIVPYLSTGGESKIATIDVVNQTIIANSLYPMSDYNQLYTTLTPPVKISGNELTTIHAAGYQWYINGVEEIGATQQTIQTSADGEYYAKVSYADGRKINSDTISVNALGLSDLKSPETITVNPNPLNEISVIDLSKLEGNAFHLKIYTAVGELALELTTTEQKIVQIEKQQLHQGMFFFLLENESGLVGKGKFVVK